MRESVAEVTLLVAALLAFGDPALPQTQSPQTRIIHVEVVGLHSDKGQVLCALYSSPDGFPKQSEKALARVSSPIAQKQAACEFSAVAPGTYAISVFHDEDSNGKLDTKFMGIPREGVGASNRKRPSRTAQIRGRCFFFLRRPAGTPDRNYLFIGGTNGLQLSFQTVILHPERA